MEKISSRKNPIITRYRLLGSDRAARRAAGEYVCQGAKLLDEALQWNAGVTSVLSAGEMSAPGLTAPVWLVPPELLDYASPLKNGAGPLFTVRIPEWRQEGGLERVIVLDGVQDPGNVGTVLRSAGAFGVDAVVLVNACADPYNFKTVRAAMGALFRQRVVETDLAGLAELLRGSGLRLLGAALGADSADIRTADLKRAAVAIGSEGAGLSEQLLSVCDGRVIIPMSPSCESLNAAVAASIVMWELAR